jgi:hypothetical protein
MRTLLRSWFLLTLLMVPAGAAVAQDHPVVQTGFAADKLYDFHGIDSVNTFNGNLTITIPIGFRYPANGGLTYGLTLTYNSKVWSYHEVTNLCGPTPPPSCKPFVMRAEPSFRSNAGMGWVLSMGRIVPPEDPLAPEPNGGYYTPDGGVHSFSPTLHPVNELSDVDPDPGTSYSRDNTYFRTDSENGLRRIDHPDGTKHYFNATGELTAINDSFGNGVTVTTITNATVLASLQECRSSESYHLTSAWQITDTDHRTHYVCWTDTPKYPKNIYGNQLVKRVVLEAPGNQKSVYEFHYSIPFNSAAPDGRGVHRGCWSQLNNDDLYPNVPMLDRLDLPDGSFYAATYNPTDACSQGAIDSLTLPTGGRLQYTYRYYMVPSGTCGDSGKWTTFSTGVSTRQIVDGMTNPTWTYTTEYSAPPGGSHQCGEHHESIIISMPNPEEAIATVVTDPTGASQKFWYSVWPFGDASPHGFDYHEYSLPLNRLVKKDDTFLSTETYNASGTLLRTNYVAYEHDPTFCTGIDSDTWGMLTHCLDSSRRVSKEQTLYEDDKNGTTPRTSVTTYTDFDGFGHYRKSDRTGTFGSDGTRTSVQNYNPGTDARGYRGSVFGIAAGDAWLPNLYDSQTLTEGGQSVKTEALFDAKGFLTHQRVLRNYANAGSFARDKHDLLAVFTRNANGNLTNEAYYGGDCLEPDPASPGNCKQDVSTGDLSDSMALPSNPAYELRHTYSHGVRESSQYFDKGAALSFKSLDRSIDSAGAITCEKDTTGLQTCYTYDTMGRVRTVTPPAGAATSYLYTKASVFGTTISSNAGATVTRGSTRVDYVFDPMGRLWREKRLMPDNSVSIQETHYDGLGRKDSVSEFEKLEVLESQFVPAYTTGYAYDIFDRPTSIRTADNSFTEFDYTGDREKTRWSRIWTGSAESRVPTVEQYDVFGRLAKVTEKSEDTTADRVEGGAIETKYGYDVAGHLTSVKMGPPNGATQDRSFDYDAAGFLKKEHHPESGDTDYSGYDARGHANYRTTGGRTLKFTFDAAERLTNVAESAGNTEKPLKDFSFGKTAGNQNGKLVSAVRHNDLTSAGKIDVTENYEYNAPGGLMSKRTTTVERVNGTAKTPVQQFEYGVDYDDLLLPLTITMPKCSLGGCNTDDGLASVTNTRNAGYLTSVDGFATLTYHPSGMVETVKHATPQGPSDTYSTRYNMPRPSKITFSGCTVTKPYFLPGPVLTKANSNECGLQVSWPPATLCGGAANVQYHVLRNGVEIASCLTTPKFNDTTVVKNGHYKYTILAEGPPVDGGTGSCQGGQLTELAGTDTIFNSCAAETFLAVDDVTASVGIPEQFRATLSDSNGHVQDEELIFSVLGQEIGRARTAANGVAILVHGLDIDPGSYHGAISVTYPGGLMPAKTVTADLTMLCDSPAYTVKPTFLNVLSAGGLFSTIVGTSSRCAWTPIPSGFLSVDPTTEQKGAGTFRISVPDLAGGASRSASVSVGAHNVMVQQNSGCSYTIEPGLAYLPAETNNFPTSMQVSAPDGCSWVVSTDVNWLYFDQNSGSGNGSIRFRLLDNLTVEKRLAKLLVNNGSTPAAYVNQNSLPPAVCPVLFYDLQGGSVEKGQNIPLRVYATGTQLRYRWFINDRSVEPFCSLCSALTIAPGGEGYPAPGQTSTFQVEVYNSCGRVVTRRVSWTNNTPPGNSCRVPIIMDSLFRENGAPGDGLSPFPGAQVTIFAVGTHFDFTSTAPLQYQWYRGLPGDRSSKVPNGTTDQITVSPFETSFYWLEVTDTCGSQQSRSSGIFSLPPPRRRRAVTHDFTGDGKSDLPWHNTATGQNELWVMNGTQHGSTVQLPLGTSGSQIQSTGDMDANGSPDLVWRNEETGKDEVWLMNRTQLAQVVPLETRPDGNWTIGAVADFDDDDNDDVVWHNKLTGENQIWFHSGTDHAGTWQLPASPSGVWGLHGAGDFNGDEKPDLFFHDKTSGANSIWIMDDAKPLTMTANSAESGLRKLGVNTLTVQSDPDPNWMPAQVADMNGDGRPDIVWRNVNTGENKVWIMSGTTLSQEQPLEARSDPNWQIGGGGSTNATPAGGTGGGGGGSSATSVTLSADPAPVNTATAVTATLKAGTTLLAQRQLIFSLNGSEKARLVTDDAGSATAAISVTGIAAGTYANAITVKFEGDATYASSQASADLVVTAAAPVTITWANPASIVYGTPLSATQLNATANVPGTFVYSPAAGAIVNAGYQTLSVTFTPSDTAIAPVTRTALIFVTKAPSAVSWTRPAAIAYGTPLSAEQLNATSALAGTFDYDPDAGAVLPVGNVQTLRVTFTPDSPNYDLSTGSTTIDVAKGTQVIRWSDPGPIFAGQPLTAAQLNATVLPSGSAPAGALTYDPAIGTVLAEGVHELRVSAAETANYNAASASADLIVRNATVGLQWAPPAPIVYGTALSAAQLNATASVPGTFTYNPPAGTVLDAGTTTLTAQFTPADSQYQPASITVPIVVNKVQAAVAWGSPEPIVYGTPLGPVQLNATANVPGTFTYVPGAGTIFDAGAHDVTMTFVPQDARNYNGDTLTVRIDVAKAPQRIVWNPPAPITYPAPLSAAQLNALVQVVGPSPAGALTYTPAAGTVLQAGPAQVLTANVAATPNYEAATATVTIGVLKATPVITWAKPASIVYGTALSAAQLNAVADVDGTWTYTPPIGTILDAGNAQTLSVHFTPADTRNYNDADTAVTIDVAKAKQHVVWAVPAPIVYGTALSAAQLDATVEVVGPAPAGALTYTPAAGTMLDAGLGQTLSVAVAGTPNYEPAAATVTLDVRRAALSLTADAKSKLYGAAVPQLTGVLTGVVNQDPITASYATTATQQSPAGTYPITPALADPNHRLVNYDVTITPATLTVLPAPLLIAANNAAKQYSDPLPQLTATYTGFVLNETPAVLGGTLVIQTTAEVLSAPGTYPIAIGGLTSSNYAITYVGATFTVTQEDARVAIISPPAVTAAASGATSVTLAATVFDISATADAAGDTNNGDIRKATLTFVDRATNAVLCTAPIGLVKSSDERAGIATCTFIRDFGTALPASFVAGAKVGGYYVRDAAADDVTMSIAAATNDLVAGAGGFDVASAAGPRAPERGTKARFEVNLQYSNKGQPSGNFKLTFTRTEDNVVHKYELALDEASSLAFRRAETSGTATIIGTGTLTDVTVSKTVAIAEHAPLVITATDGGEPGTKDSISITLFNSAGGLWLATGWNGTRAAELLLTEGNINVQFRK